MGETDDSEKNDAAAKVEKDKHENKEKHADEDGKGEKGEEKAKDKKKKKDKSGKEGKEDGGKEEEKKKNHEDKKDPAQLKLKLEKLDTKMQALAAKREEILKLLNEVEANPAGGAVPPATPN